MGTQGQFNSASLGYDRNVPAPGIPDVDRGKGWSTSITQPALVPLQNVSLPTAAAGQAKDSPPIGVPTRSMVDNYEAYGRGNLITSAGGVPLGDERQRNSTNIGYSSRPGTDFDQGRGLSQGITEPAPQPVRFKPDIGKAQNAGSASSYGEDYSGPTYQPMPDNVPLPTFRPEISQPKTRGIPPKPEMERAKAQSYDLSKYVTGSHVNTSGFNDGFNTQLGQMMADAEAAGHDIGIYSG